MKHCEECGRNNAERHHIIFRSQGGKNFKLNYKDLCYECHRGNNSPHKNRQIDLRYKKELQIKLQQLLIKDYYTIEELIKLLEIQKVEIKKTLKYLKQHTEGYSKMEVIFRLMGDKFYV